MSAFMLQWMCPGADVPCRVSAICRAISAAGRAGPMRSVAMPGQIGFPARLCARHQSSSTGKLCFGGMHDQ